MSLYLILPLLAFAFNGLLIIPVLRSNPKNSVNRIFALFLSYMALWGLTVFFMRNSSTLEEALFWERFPLATVLGATLLFFQFSFLFSRVEPHPWVLPAAYIVGGLFAALIPLDVLITGMQVKFYGYAPIITPYFYVYSLFLYLLLIMAFFNLRLAYVSASKDEERNRVGYVMAGIACTVIGGTTDILPVLGVSIYPLGIVGTLLFASLTSVAIVRHHLFDIRIAIRRGVALTLLSAMVGILYAGMALSVSFFFSLGQLPAPAWLQVLLLVTAAMALQPLYGRVQRMVDRWFSRDIYDYQRALERFAQETKDITDLGRLSQTLVELSALAMQARWALVLQPSPKDSRFYPGATFGLDPVPSFSVAADSSVMHWIEDQDGTIRADQLQLLPQWRALPTAELETWNSLGSQVFVPLKGNISLSGLLVLGPKHSGKPHSWEDLRLLQAVAHHAATTMENAQLYQEIRSELERDRRRLEALRNAAVRLALEEDSDRALQHLVEVARELLGATYGALAVWDTPGHMVKLITQQGSAEEWERVQGYIRGLGVLGLFRGVEKSIRYRDLYAHFRPGLVPVSNPPVKSFLGVSFLCKDRRSGVFYLMQKEEALEFSADDERLLSLFAVLAGVLLDNANLYRQVARERQTLAAIQASMTEGLVVYSSDRRVIYFNGAAESLLGVAAGEVLGKTFEEARGFIERGFETSLENSRGGRALLAVLEGTIDGPSTVQVVLPKDPGRELDLTAFSILVEPGLRMTGLLVRDITQERELERRRDAFVSIASHELRTPMTTIMGFSELLLNRDPPETARREWIKHIYLDSQKLTAIIEDLMNVSRIQAGKLRANVEQVNLVEVVENALVGIRPLTSEHQFVVHIPPDTPCVIADREKLGQVLTNLLTNSIKYSPRGGQITISACPNNSSDHIVVGVADQGIGIAPADQERLFTQFHRIRRTETEGIRGSGLGLYIVRSLVELMHGKVWLQSELNKGSVFFFSLPTKHVDGAS